MTISKAQGQTLNSTGLYLPLQVFGHGQLYVAMSRVKTPSSIKIMIEPDVSHPEPYVFVPEQSEDQRKCWKDARPRQRDGAPERSEGQRLVQLKFGRHLGYGEVKPGDDSTTAQSLCVDTLKLTVLSRNTCLKNGHPILTFQVNGFQLIFYVTQRIHHRFYTMIEIGRVKVPDSLLSIQSFATLKTSKYCYALPRYFGIAAIPCHSQMIYRYPVIHQALILLPYLIWPTPQAPNIEIVPFNIIDWETKTSIKVPASLNFSGGVCVCLQIDHPEPKMCKNQAHTFY
ncbi:hypothetical protein HMPREF1544_04022 [Mucor circinelloides 1006PhL]|uniref:Uncharacterized protein n=1 Tax=Mucor circinelloides f. circinelloides (strain 1006PhL) TaxID=1220926 RepID=S2KA23_MUCC1|nr:hypothetical protein HMPREF1544_04022 [Mucor circinelloides 1006PhL]